MMRYSTLLAVSEGATRKAQKCRFTDCHGRKPDP
jgi:hypothetical protein